MDKYECQYCGTAHSEKEWEAHTQKEARTMGLRIPREMGMYIMLICPTCCHDNVTNGLKKI